jgi:outer membrane protein OmpA-like peptidoglycan-associated protein
MEDKMIAARTAGIGLFSILLLLSGGPSAAQTIGYAGAIDQLAKSCGNDIGKFCKNTHLGGGRIQQCLDQNQAGVSAACKTNVSDLRALLQKRAAARAVVMRVCDADIRRMCTGIQVGDGNLMECFYKAKRNMSPQCQQTVADAGYEVGLAPASGRASIQLSSVNLIDSLQGIESTGVAINASRLRQLAEQSVNDPSRANRMNRAPLTDQLEKLAQFTIAVQFDFNSARIRPDSFRAVGLIADALYHPYLQGYRFMIVGHTDAKGDRKYNLKLSQQRADAIRWALLNPFGIPAARIEAVGLGEEQLLNRQQPEAAENRRVQLINIGK